MTRNRDKGSVHNSMNRFLLQTQWENLDLFLGFISKRLFQPFGLRSCHLHRIAAAQGLIPALSEEAASHPHTLTYSKRTPGSSTFQSEDIKERGAQDCGGDEKDKDLFILPSWRARLVVPVVPLVRSYLLQVSVPNGESET